MPGDYQFLDFVELYRKLRSLDIPFVVVGGQAVNLWASVYETEAEKLALLRPFTSRDLDIYTESQEAVTKTANALKCECILAGVDSPDIVIGALWLGELGDESPLVQFLNGTVGIKNSVPIESISKSRSPKLQRFMEHEWPVMCGQISRRREKERGKRIKSSIPPPPGA